MPFPHTNLAEAQAWFNQHLQGQFSQSPHLGAASIMVHPQHPPIIQAFEELHQDEKPHFVSELFWSVLIDQVMYSLYRERRQPPTPIHDAFRHGWPSPKLCEGGQFHNICADWLILNYGGEFNNMMQVLREDKFRLWDSEVKPWLRNQLGEGNWRPYRMYAAFREELNTRGYMQPALSEELFPD